VSGLAYANSIAFTAGMMLLAFLARRRLGGLGMRSILLTFVKSILGSMPMAAVLVFFLRWKPELWMHGGSLGATLLIAAVVAACVILTLLMYIALRVPFLADLFNRRRMS
jgi:peptidoglycan biosynthesis protein MviN/MurJ (putative lipid II flippase)